jgi:hypothetical protein
VSSDGKTLFGRKYNVTIGTLEVSSLRCVFKAKKDLKPLPNSCEIKVYNLSAKSRALLAAKSVLPVRVEAGYESTGTAQLFLGEVRSAHSTVDGADWITEVTTGDGDKAFKTHIHLSIGPSLPVSAVLDSIVAALKVGRGNVGSIGALLATKGVATMYGAGSAISGSAWRALLDLCRSAGLEASIQDGNIQILDLNKALASKAVSLSSSTGLIGSPTVDGHGVVKARSLIIPELAPGRLVVFDSKSVQGGYRLQSVEFNGDTHGTDWYADLECKKY